MSGTASKRADCRTRSLTPFSSYTLTQSARETAARGLILAALSTERFRRSHATAPPAPVGLPEDPFSGQPLVFKADPTGYLMYSLDVNRKDDGGALYGIGAGGPRNFSLQTRDYGIRVPFHPNLAPITVVK